MTTQYLQKIVGVTLGFCLIFAPLWAAAAGAMETMRPDAGRWIVRAGVVTVRPTSSTVVNGGTEAEGKVEFQPAETAAASATYLFASNWAINLWLTAPAEHDLKFSMQSMTFTVASADLQETTLSLLYRFRPAGRIRPYVGGGVNMATYSGEEFNPGVGAGDLDLKRSYGIGAQAGVDVSLGRHWLVNAEMRYAESDPTIYVDGAKLQKLQIDPLSIELNAGWQF